MRNARQTFGMALKTTVLLSVIGLALAAGAQAPKNARPATGAKGEATAEADAEQTASTRRELIDLLNMSPKAAAFVKRDPMLLADQEYVGRMNPKLADFLKSHPEVARNPEFYLFANLQTAGDNNPYLNVDESQWIIQRGNSNTEEILMAGLAFLAFVVILSVLVWLLRVLLDNRRWNRVFKVQTEIYNKLLDKFSTNEEMLAYIRSESGKRFLDSATLPVASMQPGVGNPMARVLAPLQLGVILEVIGAGMIVLRSHVRDVFTPLSVFGTLALMAGIGLIISAGLAFVLARHFGLMPQSSAQPGNGLNQHSEVS